MIAIGNGAMSIFIKESYGFEGNWRLFAFASALEQSLEFSGIPQ
jgi:hypothetical protein